MTTTVVETYYWLLDRLNLSDDTRNKVNTVTNVVTLSKPFLKKIDNGHFIGKLLVAMYPTFAKRSDKQFSVPSFLGEIDPDSPTFNQQTFRPIFEYLALYGIELTPKKQAIILQTNNTQILLDIVEAQYEIDLSPQGTLHAQTKRKLEIRTTFGSKKSEFQRPEIIVPDIQLANGRPSSERKLSIPGSVQARRASMKLQPLDADVQLSNRKQAPRQVQQSPGRLLGQEALLIQDLSADHIDELMPSTLAATRTSVQFILQSVSMAFELKPKQATALLANNNQLLTHLCIKGGKEGNYNQVIAWYKLLQQNSDHLMQLIVQEKAKDIPIHLQQNNRQVGGKELLKTLNILKYGFYSRNSDVQIGCGTLFIQLQQQIWQTNNEIVNDAWEWFTTSTAVSEFRTSPVKQIGSHLIRAQQQQQSEGNRDFDSLQGQCGLHAIIYAYRTTDKFAELAAQLLLLCSKTNPADLFTQRLKQQAYSWNFYSNFCLDLFLTTQEEPLFKECIESSGVLRFWITNCFQVADSTGEVPLDDRIASLVFLGEIWRLKTSLVEQFQPQASDQVVNILKRAARDMKRTLVIIAIEMMFRVLESFTAQKNPFAPTLYKTLTFLLVEFYWEVDVRELMVRQFMALFASYENVPISILCEPLLKQIEISQYHEASFNVFDFEFFNSVANNRKLTLPTALLLMDSLTKIAISSVFYQGLATSIIQTLMDRFAFAQELVSHWSEATTTVLQTLVMYQSRFVLQKYHLRNESQNFYKRLALKSSNAHKVTVDKTGTRMSDFDFQQMQVNEKLIVNLFVKVLNVENKQVNQNILTQLLDSYNALYAQIKHETKAIKYLLRFFTQKVDDIILDRAVQYPQAANQIQIPYLNEIQQMEHDPAFGQRHNPGAVDIYASSKIIKERSKSPPKAVGTKNQLALMMSPSTSLSVALPLSTGEKKKAANDIAHLLYDYEQWEEDWEIKQYTQFLKKHQRVYKELHRHYSTVAAAKKPQAVDKSRFDQYERVVNEINSQSLVRMIKDFKLDNGVPNVYLKEEVQKLVKAISVHILKDTGSVYDLPFEGFVHFLLQYANWIWPSGDQRAFALVSKLFAQMREQSKFKQLGLTMLADETTNRQQVDLLQKIEQNVNKGGENVPLNHKKVQDSIRVVEYEIPDYIPMQRHKRMAIELMDEILAKALGIHFLEPVAKVKQVTKIVPQIQSLRHGSYQPQSPFVNPAPLPIKGKVANEPISHQVALTMEQIEAKKRYYEKFEKKKILGDPASTDVSRSLVSDAQKLQFKAQALNRRAKEFGEAMQITIIKEPMPDKQIMFEAAEVLNEVLKAVESNKKALRLDFTPYRLHNMYKKKLPKPTEEPIAEEEDLSVKKEKRNKVKNFIEKASIFILEQAEQLELNKKQALQSQEKNERLKALRQEEYSQVVEVLADESEKQKQDRNKQKQAQESAQKQQQSHSKQQTKEALKERNEKYKNELRQKEEYYRQRIDEVIGKEDESKSLIQRMSDRWSHLHKKKLEQVSKIKPTKMDEFYAWVESDAIQFIVNRKYKRGLFLKYEQCLKIGKKNSGVTQEAWLEWLRQTGMLARVDPKLLIRIHSTQVKEMQAMKDYQQYFQGETKDDSAIPGDKELSYGAFVAALIKVSNLEQLTTQSQNKNLSQVKHKDYDEYQIPDAAGENLEQTLAELKVSAAKV